MNKAILIGRLTRDPELRTTPTGRNVCQFAIAVNRTYTSASGEREADFLPIIVWRGQAENCYKYLKKGSKAAISGSVQTRSYEATDGSRRYMTEIIADEVEFLASRGNGSDDIADDGEAEEKKDVVSKFEPIDDDNLPF